MEEHASFVGEPLAPDELERLARVYNLARSLTVRSRHDPAAQRLAAMAIRFYQLGVRDDDVLLAMIIGTHQELLED